MMICPAIVPTTELDMPEASSANRKVPAAAAPSSGVRLSYAVAISTMSLRRA